MFILAGRVVVSLPAKLTPAEEMTRSQLYPIAEQCEGWDDEVRAGLQMWSSEIEILWIRLVKTTLVLPLTN
jgi:hypothetical protein